MSFRLAKMSLALALAKGTAAASPTTKSPGTHVSPASEYSKGSVTGTLISTPLFLKVAVAVASQVTIWLPGVPKFVGSFSTMSLNFGPMSASWET